MKFLHSLFGALMFVLVLAGGLFIVFGTTVGPEYWDWVLGYMQQERFITLFAGLGVLILLVLFVLTGFTRERLPPETISFEGHNGRVTINIKAVRDFIQKVAGEFTGILNMNPRLGFRGGALDVELDIRVRGGTRIPELCQMLQDRVRECVQENLGFSEVRKVRVNVREIVGTAPDERPDEPLDEFEKTA